MWYFFMQVWPIALIVLARDVDDDDDEHGDVQSNVRGLADLRVWHA